MRVWFNEISPHGSRFELHEIRDLVEQQDFVVNGPVRADCSLERKGDDKVAMRGRVEVDILLTCDRCVQLYPFRISAAFQLLFALESGDARRQVREVAPLPVDSETELLDEPVIDLDDVLRQQVYLAIPVKRLCAETCRGLCRQCGANLNEIACTCERLTKESPLAVLAQWKK